MSERITNQENFDDSPSLDLLNNQAKEAFESNNSEASKQAHEQKSAVIHHKEKHNVFGEYVKSIVFGGLDGIITTFAIVAASVGGGLTTYELLIVGFANLIGDAFAMGLGDFFSSRAQIEQENKTRKDYLWKCENEPEEQKSIMIETFRKKGFDSRVSNSIIDLLAENTRAFADVMLLEVEGICFEEDHTSPWKNGLATFISFIFFGSIPLVAFFFRANEKLYIGLFFFISMGLTAISLYLLGATKNIILARSWWRGGLYVLLTGGIATGIAYLAGFLIELLIKLIDAK
eukprot:gene1967-1475_t